MNRTVYGAGLASYPAGVLLRASVYSTNLRPAFSLVCADDEMPYGVLSVNLPDANLADDEFLSTVLRFRAERRGLTLPEEVASYIVHRAPRSLDRLLELLDRLDRASLAEKRALSIPFVKQSLGW